MNIREKLVDLINCLKSKLPIADIKNAKEYIDNNEFGIALELICTQLVEYNISINKELYAIIKDVGSLIGIEKQFLQDIDVR